MLELRVVRQSGLVTAADTTSGGRLFALVPINQLSSSFTRIDGTEFTGAPGV